MKNFALTIAFIAATSIAYAQGFQATTYVEQTHISPKLGSSLSYEFVGDYPFEVGGFYQKSTVELEAEAGRPLTSEMEFYGAFFAYPLLKERVASIKFNVRTGVSNGQNFVITPSLMADFKPLRNVSLGGGIGTRSFKPTYMASLKINLNPGPKAGGLLALK